MKKIEVGIFTNVIDNRKARGTALVARKFLEQLDLFEDRFSFTLIHNIKTNDPLYKKHKEIIITQVNIPFAKQLISEILFWVKYIFSGAPKFDIFHYLHPRIWPSYLFTRSKKIIVTAFDGGIMQDIFRPSLGDRLFRFTNRHLNFRMNKIISCSESGREEIIKYYKLPQDRVKSILLGVDPIYKPVERNKAEEILSKNYNVNYRYFLAVSRFDPHKNILRLIDAYQLILKNHPDIHLVFVGGAHTPGYSEKVLKEINTSNKVKENIHILPFVEDNHLPALYSNTIALVYPSLHEGFGLPVVEAMSCGAPVVSSDSTSLPEVGGDAVIYIDPNDTESIAKSMERILTENGLADHLSKAGLEQAKKFSWKKMASEIIEEYEKILLK